MNAGIIQILENEAANSERRELLRKARAEFDRFAAGIYWPGGR